MLHWQHVHWTDAVQYIFNFENVLFIFVFTYREKKKLNMYYNLMRLPNVVKLKFVLFSVKMAMTTVSDYTHQKRCKYLMMGQRKRAIMWKIYCLKISRKEIQAPFDGFHICL